MANLTNNQFAKKLTKRIFIEKGEKQCRFVSFEKFIEERENNVKEKKMIKQMTKITAMITLAIGLATNAAACAGIDMLFCQLLVVGCSIEKREWKTITSVAKTKNNKRLTMDD